MNNNNIISNNDTNDIIYSKKFLSDIIKLIDNSNEFINICIICNKIYILNNIEYIYICDNHLI